MYNPHTQWTKILHKVHNVLGHLKDLRIVVLCKLVELSGIIVGDKVNCDTLATKTTATPDSMKCKYNRTAIYL